MQPVFAPRTSRARVSYRLALLLSAVLVPLALVLAFTWAPTNEIGLLDGEMQYDFPQKIFYLHVPVALAAYLAFAAGAWNGLLYLLRERADYDVRSYVGVHVGIVFGTIVLLSGSIWAKASWGQWWNWGDTQLLVFLTMYLFYATYFIVRFSIEPGRARERTSAVFAVLGAAVFPMSFLAIRIADTLIHPVVLTTDGGRLTGPMWGTFGLGVLGFAALAVLMQQLEVAAKLRATRGYAADDEQVEAVAHA